MGCWGYGLLQSDSDHDVASEISSDAGFELYLYWDMEGGALGLEGTRQKLNEGVFNTLFNKYKSATHGGEFYVVILVVLAMQVGATISKRQIAYTRSIYRHVDLMDEACNKCVKR